MARGWRAMILAAMLGLPWTASGEPAPVAATLRTWVAETARAVFEDLRVRAGSLAVEPKWGGPSYIRNRDHVVVLGLPSIHDPLFFEVSVTFILGHEAMHEFLSDQCDLWLDARAREMYCDAVAILHALKNPRTSSRLARADPDAIHQWVETLFSGVPSAQDRKSMVADLVFAELGPHEAGQSDQDQRILDVLWRYLPGVMWAPDDSAVKGYLLSQVGLANETARRETARHGSLSMGGRIGHM